MENTTDVLIRQLKAVNKKIGVDWDKIKEYKPNSIYQDGDVYALSYASQLIYEQHESLEDIYEDIWEMEDKLEEMADERETAGIMASMGTAKGLNMADAKLGWSNKGVKGNVVESVTGDIA